jgi:DNA-binding CsgD family transcriptional regulator
MTGWPASRDVLALICPDRRGAALILEAPTWRIAHANRRCVELAGAADGPASIADGRLMFRDRVFHARFFARLEAAARGGQAPVVLIGRTSSEWFSTAIRFGRGYVMVEFAVTGQAFEPSAREAFAAAFGLTPAEMELAELIAMGLGAEVAARRRGAALSTVRQRVKTVLAKTGCRRQLELARLVNALLPA